MSVDKPYRLCGPVDLGALKGTVLLPLPFITPQQRVSGIGHG